MKMGLTLLQKVLPGFPQRLSLTIRKLFHNSRDLRVIFLRLSKLGPVVLALSLTFLQPAIIRAEDEQGTQTAPESENEPPAQETPNFFPNTSQPAQPAAPSPTPAPAATDHAEPSADPNLGVGKFAAFPFHLSISVLGGYDDNVITTSAQGKPSIFINPSAQLDYKFGNPRTDGSLRLGGGISYYLDRPGDQAYDINASLGLSIVHKATARLTVGGAAYLTYQTEPDFSANVGTNRRSGNYFYSSDRPILNYQWLPRFSTASSYNVVFVKYDDKAIGSIVDRTEHTLGTEFRFLLSPPTTVIIDARLQIVSYDQSSNLDSLTEVLLAGLEHNFSKRSSISLRAGGENRSFDNGSSRTQPYFEGTFTYVAGRRTTLSWTNRYSLEEPGTSGGQSRTTFRTGLQAKYGFTKRISATIAGYFVHDDYAAGPPVQIGPFVFPGAPAFTENSLDLTLGARYEINRVFAIDLGYGHTEVTSDFSQREYSRNRYFGGLNLTF